MRVTLEEVKRLLDYSNVEEFRHEYEGRFLFKKYVCRHHEFRVLPSGTEDDHINLVFDVAKSGDMFFLQISFGPWHSHLEENQSEEDNLEEAIRFAKQLIDNELVLVVRRDERGNYRSGRVCQRDKICRESKHRDSESHCFNST